jgi:hypothetical protein
MLSVREMHVIYITAKIIDPCSDVLHLATSGTSTSGEIAGTPTTGCLLHSVHCSQSTRYRTFRRHYAASQNVPGSIPDYGSGFLT